MSTLEERLDVLRGSESLAKFAKRVGVTRGALYAAMSREKKTGKHTLDSATAERLVAGTKYTLAWIVGDPAVAIIDGGVPTSAMLVRDSQQGAPYGTPHDEDGMRWRALCELKEEDGEKELARAIEILATAEFDRKKKPPTWGDFYHLAKRRLREGRGK